MTGAELKSIRLSTGLSVRDFGRALGYRGTDNNIVRFVQRLEKGERIITSALAERARALQTVEPSPRTKDG